MEDILEDVETIQEQELLFSIWTKPEATLDFILRECPRKYVNALINCSGIAGALAANIILLLNHIHFSAILIIVIASLGWLLGWLWVYLFATLLSWTGRWIGGRAEMDQFVTVIAWSYLPVICSLVPLVLEEIVYGDESTSVDTTGQNMLTTGLYYLLLVIKAGLTIWSFVLLARGTAVVQKFPNGKAFLNTILPVLIILVLFVIIAGMIYLL